jgi:hypothetical protein
MGVALWLTALSVWHKNLACNELCFAPSMRGFCGSSASGFIAQACIVEQYRGTIKPLAIRRLRRLGRGFASGDGAPKENIMWGEAKRHPRLSKPSVLCTSGDFFVGKLRWRMALRLSALRAGGAC